MCIRDRPITNIIVQDDGCSTERKEHKGEGKADLTKEVKRQVRIVPDIPSEPEIYETAGGKFNTQGEKPDVKCFFPEWIVCLLYTSRCV